MGHPTALFIVLLIVVCLVAGGASARGWLDGTAPHNRLRAASVAGAIALVAALSTLYYRWIWHDLQTFAAFIDSCPTLFCDFDKHFYPQGQVIRSSAIPAPGYFYSAPFALLLGSFADVPLGQAREYWGALQAIFTAALFAVPLLWAPDVFGCSGKRAALYTLAFALSVPVLHNFKWGQVSAMLTVAVLLSLWLGDRGHSGAAGLLLALGISAKYYPAIFLVHFISRRDWRTVTSAVAWTAMFFLVTGAMLGFGPAVQFQTLGQASFQSAERWIARDANSQYAGFLPLRWFTSSAVHLARLTTWLGYLVCLANVVLLYLARARCRSTPGLWAALLLFTTVPFWVPTSWPHYFVYLPALQLFVWHDLTATGERRLSDVLGWGLLMMSMVSSSSLLLVHVAATWSGYSHPGYLFASNACLVLYAYGRLIPHAAHARRVARQPESGH
jgi:alpha-1,2-mannosyltransferase